MSTPRLLSLLLVAQVALVAITWWPRDRSALRPHPLLELDADAISRLEIARKPGEGTDPQWLRLAREGQAWRIESQGGYPADPAKVQQLIDKLLGMQVRAPIATRTTSHNALEVGDQDYGRRVRVVAGELQRELVVGAAQSNSVNVRLADSDDVYLASGVSEWSLRDDARSYWASEYVQVDPAQITELRAENDKGVLVLRRAGEGEPAGWSLDGLPEGAAPDSDVIERFVGGLTTLRLSEPVGDQVLPEHGLDSGVRVSWTIASENASVGGGYAVGAEADGQVFVKSDSSPFVVKVAASAVDDLRNAEPGRFYSLPLEDGPADDDAEPAGDR